MATAKKIKPRYGRLTVIKEVERYTFPSGTTKRQVFVECDCGAGIYVLLRNLETGNTKSCGCASREAISSANRVHGEAGKTKMYRIWKNIHSRTNNTNRPYYKYYGGRGIKVCKRWKDYRKFKSDMGDAFDEHYSKYGEDTTIERINVDRDYKPSNCRWATRKEQANNTTRNNNYVPTKSKRPSY